MCVCVCVVVGRRYVEDDFELASVNSLSKDASGVQGEMIIKPL